MKVALIALPGKQTNQMPPLTLAYVAAVLEQRRIIVRMYDHALDATGSWHDIRRRLQTFQPQRVIVGGEDSRTIEQAVAQIHQSYPDILPLLVQRNGTDAPAAITGVLAWLDGVATVNQCLPNDVPFPARHLLSLEHYPLRAPGGELQTPVVIGWHINGQWHMRQPRQIGQELRTLVEEAGIRHVLFYEPALTIDEQWFTELLNYLISASLNVKWQAAVALEHLDEETIPRLVQAGCEALTFVIAATSIFDSASRRNQARKLLTTIREHGIYTHATILLEPPYESIARLIDVAATFSLNDVSFELMQTIRVGDDEQTIKRFARQRYQEGQIRQRLIDRFGPVLGGLLWQLRVQHVDEDEELGG